MQARLSWAYTTLPRRHTFLHHALIGCHYAYQDATWLCAIHIRAPLAVFAIANDVRHAPCQGIHLRHPRVRYKRTRHVSDHALMGKNTKAACEVQNAPHWAYSPHHAHICAGAVHPLVPTSVCLQGVLLLIYHFKFCHSTYVGQGDKSQSIFLIFVCSKHTTSSFDISFILALFGHSLNTNHK